MATAMVGAAFSVVGKALAPLTDGLLKNWAASVKLGPNVEALEIQLLSVQAMLEPTLNREIDNSALKKLLVRLQDLGGRRMHGKAYYFQSFLQHQPRCR
ncbi:hypothetical protein C2845_PM05G01960 [Panicum miliaceum]|uniref:Rx N-terminal domain-containing protein n=1 Tax=Panicum miliaceum TaxID=4540 RepID=A0A3L6T4U9_PANMI|nr:hypothetical protein C2845_PM05G01960 [Panicum miliaceum]